MITVADCREYVSPKGAASLNFTVEYRTTDGALEMRVKGARIMGGYLYGPSRRLPNGGYTPHVEFYGSLKAAIVDAAKAAGWEKDFPAVQFPAVATPEAA